MEIESNFFSKHRAINLIRPEENNLEKKCFLYIQLINLKFINLVFFSLHVKN